MLKVTESISQNKQKSFLLFAEITFQKQKWNKCDWIKSPGP